MKIVKGVLLEVNNEDIANGTFEFPVGVTGIGESAFQSCTHLTSITIPEGVTSIGSCAFANCTGLTSITIPDGVTSIGDGAFFNCASLTSITIPNSVTSIDDGAFHSCISLTNITFNGTKEQWAAITKGDNWDGATGAYTIHYTDTNVFALYVDMDGSIARFYDHANCLELMYSEGFFKNLDAYENVVEGLKRFIAKNKRVTPFILSAYPDHTRDFTVPEKTEWCQKWIPEIKTMYFLPSRISKVDAVGRNLTRKDILIDDYNKNLEEWRAAGGTAVKLVNDINNKGTNGPLWDGAFLLYSDDPDDIACNLQRIVDNIAGNSPKQEKTQSLIYKDCENGLVVVTSKDA